MQRERSGNKIGEGRLMCAMFQSTVRPSGLSTQFILVVYGVQSARFRVEFHPIFLNKNWNYAMMCPGDTPLHLAIQSFEGDVDSIKILLEKDDSGINVRNSEGETPLLLAARNERCSLKLIELLLKHGADVKATSPRDGNTALHLVAIILGYTEYVEWYSIASTLLSNGSDTNAQNLKGSTPLHLAAEGRGMYASIIMLPLRHMSDVNARNSNGDTPLHLYMLNDEVHILEKKRFLESTGDVNFLVNIVNSKGETPLHLAVRSRQCDLFLIKKFLELGADVNITDATGENVYQAFCRINRDQDNNRRQDDMLMSKTLLRRSLQENLSSSLHVACLFLNVESVRNLLRKGADVNALDSFGRVPLSYAISNRTPNDEDYANQCSTVALLLDYGTDVNQQREPPCRENNFRDYPETLLESGILRLSGRYRRPDNSSNLFLEMRDIFIQHAAKLLALQEKQNERGIDVQLLDERSRQLLNTYDRLGETGYMVWLSRCYEELQAMSETKIGDSRVSFYDLLVASAKETAKNAKNKELVKAFNAKKAMFPMYQGMLEAKIDPAVEHRNLLASAADCLSDILHFADPSDVFFERTFYYLSDQDLMRLTG